MKKKTIERKNLNENGNIMRLNFKGKIKPVTKKKYKDNPLVKKVEWKR